jgi:hypothetical protein
LRVSLLFNSEGALAQKVSLAAKKVNPSLKIFRSMRAGRETGPA